MKRVVKEIVLMLLIIVVTFISIIYNRSSETYCYHSINDRFYPMLSFIVMCFYFILFLIFSVKYYWNKNSILLLSLIPSIFCLLFLFTSNKDFIKRSNFHESFSQKKWEQKRSIKITRTIIQDDLLIGKNKEEVLNLLGNNDVAIYDEQLEYSIEQAYYLFVYLENKKVYSCELGCVD